MGTVAVCRARWRTPRQRRIDDKVWRVWCAIAGESHDEFYNAIESSPLRIDGDMMPDQRSWYPQSLLSHACECCNLEAIAYLLSMPTTHTTYAECDPHMQPMGLLQDNRHSVGDILKALDLFHRCPPERAQIPYKDAKVIYYYTLLSYRLVYGSDLRILLKCMAMGMYDAKHLREVKVQATPEVRLRIQLVEARQALVVIMARERRAERAWMPEEIWRLVLRMLTR